MHIVFKGRGFCVGLWEQKEMDIKSLINMEVFSPMCPQRYFKAHDSTSDAVLKSPYLLGDVQEYWEQIYIYILVIWPLWSNVHFLSTNEGLDINEDLLNSREHLWVANSFISSISLQIHSSISFTFSLSQSLWWDLVGFFFCRACLVLALSVSLINGCSWWMLICWSYLPSSHLSTQQHHEALNSSIQTKFFSVML